MKKKKQKKEEKYRLVVYMDKKDEEMLTRRTELLGMSKNMVIITAIRALDSTAMKVYIDKRSKESGGHE